MTSRRTVCAVVLAGGMALAGAPAVSAGQAPPIAPHRHFLLTPQGQIPVGPQVCENADLQAAFNQFHAAVHVGPANSAFDHSHNPVDIRAGAC